MKRDLMNPSKNNRLGRRKIRLWKQDPHCFWCGIETVITQPNRYRKDNDISATIDHLDSVFNPLTHLKAPDGFRTVLSCKKCNSDRNIKEQKLVGIQKTGLRKIIRKIRKFIKNIYYRLLKAK